MKTRLLLCIALGLVASSAMAGDEALSLRFSDSATGSQLPAGWKHYPMSRHKTRATIGLVRDGDTTVLHIDANRGAGGIAHALRLPPEQILSWRWKVDHSVAKANLARKRGDDFAARVYVFFDVPASALSFGQRLKLRMARAVMGHALPRAALCYVWDNTHPVGTIAPNAYYGAVRTIVLQSGNAHAGQWQSERRDVAADFRAAFGRPAPEITGVAVASDTDNTSGHVNAWFGDLTFSAPAAASESTDE
ncbi:DUF3047 domain-containing protein [Rhodanobacter caeni]|uniref:DUF3047 domain-containing protein n=1 Tax=Rhodanobacter caeni TaxID=657654 RepID=A0ABN0U9Z3_9GAMM